MRSIRRMSTLAWLPVILTVATPAMSTAQDETPTETTPETLASLPDPMVIVANHNWLDVHVYASSPAGGQVSLGVVTSHTTREFELPAIFFGAGGDVHVIADPIGSRDSYVTPAVVADPGTNVVVRIENALNLSSAHLMTASSPGSE